MKRHTLIWAVLLAVVMAAAVALAEVPPDASADDFIESQYAVLVDTFADRTYLAPGDEFIVAARAIPYNNGEIHFHMYGSEPSEDWSYVPSVAAMDAADDVEWSAVVFPPGQPHDTQMWLIGQPVIYATGKLAADAEPGPRTFTAQFLFSACTEMMCLQPSQIQLSWEMEVVAPGAVPEQQVLTLAEMQQPVEVDISRYTLPAAQESNIEIFPGGESEDGGKAAPAGGFDIQNVNVESGAQWPLWKLLIFALLGGLILNVMPCVLPVVSIKVIDLAKGVEQDPRTMINHGLIFAAGIIATFLAGALAIVGIQAAGTQLGWGFQFQNPTFLIVMIAIVFVFGLSLADVFKFKAPSTVTEGGEGLAEKEGYVGSFFKGVLATLLGTPCVGPFLGYALIAAFTLGAFYTLMIFLFVGIGMALPYVLLLPFVARMGRRDRGRFSRRLQESKDSLTLFKHFMSFMLFGTVVWLFWTLAGVMGPYAIVWVLALLASLALIFWLWGKLVLIPRTGLVWAVVVSVVLILLSGWYFIPRSYRAMEMTRTETKMYEEQIISMREALRSGGASGAATPISTNGHEGWEDFSLALLQDYLADGRTVLVDFTADWCPNCKYNEKTALNIDSTKELKDELDIVFLYADWTTKEEDDEIGNVLIALGFNSVPLTAIFPGNDPNNPILLDGVYTPARLHDSMREAVSR
ncbi:thioredoxin family protein [bacterium]|nr:thioredoxin family protein [bacterium]